MSAHAKTATLQFLPLTALVESPWNPRKHFDALKQASLSESLLQHGQLTAALARPLASGKFELAAGHRRYRAAKAAGIETLKVEVREMDDAEFIAVLTIENDERADTHPLEQAEGYKLLMEKAGYDVAAIAKKIDRGHDYVYDRLALLRLLPKLKELFFENRFQLAHAIILAKLGESEQAKVSTRDGGLWRRDVGATLDEKVFPLVPVTPAELRYKIARTLRFDEEQVALEEILPETAVLLEAAEETGTRVVSITHETHLNYQAKDHNDRTYTADFWERADGEDGSKPCEYAVVGIIRTGEGRGQAQGVCLRRDKCLVHWKTQAIAHQKREAARAKQPKKKAAPTPIAKVNPAAAALEKAKIAHQQLLNARGDKVEAIYGNNLKVATKAAYAAAPESAFGASGKIGRLLVSGFLAKNCDSYDLANPAAKKRAPVSGGPVAIVRWLVEELLFDDDRPSADIAEALGVDHKALRKAAEAAVEPVPAFVPPAKAKKVA